MGDTEEARRFQSAYGTSPSTISIQSLSVNPLHISQMRTSMQNFNQNFGVETGKRAGIPPSHPNNIPPISPYSQIPVSRNANQQLGSQNFGPGLSHSRSLSQSSFFSYDLLPPLSPSTYRDSPTTSISDHVLADVSMEDREWKPPSSPFVRGNNDLRACESLPPRKAHRRSNSDIPIGFSNVMQSSPPVMSFRENFGFVKQETSGDSNTEGMGERKSEGEVVDDLFSAYMNMDNIDTLNSSGTDEKHVNENSEGLDSRASGTKTNDSSENEAESIVNESGPHMSKPGLKRSAGHFRSVSMDSFMGNMNFGEDLTKNPSSNGSHSGQLSPGNSMDGNVNSFCLEYGNGEFSGAELKKIMTNDKLAELALSDPKRVKRILANRQSAARSKERKTRYISELEHKVQTLQSEATKLSAQLTHLQRDSAGINSQNNELKFRLQAMEQQAQLREALNEALTAEVQRLKINPKRGGDPLMFQRAQQQSAQLSLQQLQLHEQQNKASQPPLHQNSATTKQESDQ